MTASTKQSSMNANWVISEKRRVNAVVVSDSMHQDEES